MCLTLNVKPFTFNLIQPLETAKGIITGKSGWLIQLINSKGHYGWGEVSPLNKIEAETCRNLLEKLSNNPSREVLETKISTWPGSLAFGIGAALAEIDGLIGDKSELDWLKAPKSAILLPQNESFLYKVNEIIKDNKYTKEQVTLKWKIGIKEGDEERFLLKEISKSTPNHFRFRLDGNAGLTRSEVKLWVNQLSNERKLDWLEQPLSTNDLEGHYQLSKEVPIALDQSLQINPSLRNSWRGWQIRHPVLDGDPRNLLKELTKGMSNRVICTAFETGIGSRWVHHLSALQKLGPTPTAPGLAPGWCPKGPLFSNDPSTVWDAA